MYWEVSINYIEHIFLIKIMNRPKQYKREEVLAIITDLFWDKGFEALSTDEIVSHTKINKFSIYNEFGNKDKLFQACIDYYINNQNKFMVDILTKKPLGLKNIEEFFNEINRHFYPSKKNKGCLVFNSVTQSSNLSDSVNLKVNRYTSMIELLIKDCLQAAQKRKEISKQKDCKILAKYLTCFAFGLINYGMKKTSKEELKEMKYFALSSANN